MGKQHGIETDLVQSGQSTGPNNKADRSRRANRKLKGVLVLIAAVMFARHPAALMGAAGFFLCGLLWAGIPWRTIARRLLLVVPFGLGAIVFVPFQHADNGTAMFHVLGWTATEEGMRRAIVLALQIVSVNFLLTYWLLTTPLFDLIRSLRTVRVPAILLEMIGLMIRYLYLLKEEVRSMVTAQRSRGFRSEGWIWGRRTYRRFGELLGVLFIRAYSRSGRIYQSITARGGFGAEIGDSFLTDKAAAEEDGGMAIHVQNVTYRYGSAEALRGISFHITEGTKTVLMGPNGAGKSTLISLLNGLERPTTGEVAIFGERITPANAQRLRRRVGVVYQDPDDQLFSTTVEEDVAFGPRNLGLDEQHVEACVTEALRAVGMLEHRHRSPFELSYGQKRRAAIAGVLAMRPDIIVLDEPMAFLDPRSRDALQQLLEQMYADGLTLIVATHDVDFAAEWANDVLILKEGRLLAEGAAEELLFDNELLEQADLHLPRLARPFRLLQESEHARPRNVREAAQAIWQLIKGGDRQLSRTIVQKNGWRNTAAGRIGVQPDLLGNEELEAATKPLQRSTTSGE